MTSIVRLALLVCLVSAVAFSQGQDTDPPIEVEPLKTSITVIGELESPASGYITSFSDQSLASRPGVNVDDRLRDIPGFTLFRRSSSFVAHPTSQGVALRGIGSSAASRTLVLYDGLPANDPFGGWVYWSRFNPEAVGAVELSRGASTSVYGDRAMGGVISLFTPSPENRHAWASLQSGSAGIVDLNGGYSNLYGKHGISAAVRGFRSEGYYNVPSEIRGSADTRLDVDFLVNDFRWDYFRDQDRLTFRANILAEQRQNGTQLRENSSSLGTAGLHYQRGGISASAYHSRGALRSTFSALSVDRNIETLNLLQRVPFDDTGGSLSWNKTTSVWNLLLGADTHRASGISYETVVAIGAQRELGGRLWQQGLFAQTDFAAGSRTRIYTGLRHDFTDRGNDFWSPRGGIAVTEGPRRWRASAYRSFRAPTLNEFFRQFRVGNILTLNNPDLAPETLVGTEGGVDWRQSGFLFRGTVFWQRIDDLVGNATISTGAVITRRRENFGSATSRGAEIEMQRTFGRLRLEAAYLYVDSQLDDENRWMPQVPRHQGSVQLLYSSGATLVSAGIRPSALQFEDDLNQFVLPGFATVQLMLQRRLGKGVSAIFAAENLFNRTFLAGFDPQPTTGTPRLMRVGLKWETGR